MAAKWPSPEAEYVQSPEPIGLRELATRWNTSISTMARRSKEGDWPAKRIQFAHSLNTKTAEKTAAKIEVVAEAHADATAEIVAEQLKNYRGAISTLVNVLSKAQKELVRRPEMLQDMAAGDFIVALRRMTDGMDKAIRGQRVVLRLDKPDRDDAPPPITVQVLQVAMADPEMRRLLQELSFRMGEAGK